MAQKRNPIFDESKIIKKENNTKLLDNNEMSYFDVDNNQKHIISNNENFEKPIQLTIISSPSTVLQHLEDSLILPDQNSEKKEIKPKIEKENLSDKGKEYLNIIENEKKVKKINKKLEIIKQNVDEEKILILQSMLETLNKNIIKAKLEVQIHKELYQNEYQKEDKNLYEEKIKLFGKDLSYFEKRKNIIETILNNEINKK